MSKKCPPTKILNPATGRCINDTPANRKKIGKPVKKSPVKKSPKNCPPKKILNPATGRCINDTPANRKKIGKPVKKIKREVPKKKSEMERYSDAKETMDQIIKAVKGGKKYDGLNFDRDISENASRVISAIYAITPKWTIDELINYVWDITSEKDFTVDNRFVLTGALAAFSPKDGQNAYLFLKKNRIESGLTNLQPTIARVKKQLTDHPELKGRKKNLSMVLKTPVNKSKVFTTGKDGWYGVPIEILQKLGHGKPFSPEW